MKTTPDQRIQILKWTSYILALVAFISLLYTFPTISAELGISSRVQSPYEEPIKIIPITVTPGPKDDIKEQPTPFGGFYRNDRHSFAFLYPDIYTLIKMHENKLVLELTHDEPKHRTVTIEITNEHNLFQQLYDAHIGETVGDKAIKLSSGTIADAPTVEYLVNNVTLTRVIRKKDIFIELSATRNTKQELKDVKTVLDYITKNIHFYDETYYTDTINWQTFMGEEITFRYPLNIACTEDNASLDTILERHNSYSNSVVCKDILGNRIDIAIGKNDQHITLDNAIGYSPNPGYENIYIKSAIIYKTRVAGIDAVRADNETEPRRGDKMTEIIFFKDNYMYRITVIGDGALRAIDNILNTLQFVKD